MPSNAFSRQSAAIQRPRGVVIGLFRGTASLIGSLVGELISESKPSGQAEYTAAGTYSWTVPADVESICVVCIGGGAGGSYEQYTSGSNVIRSTRGGAGGSLSYKNNIPVTPGASYTVVVGSGGPTYSGSAWTPSSVAGTLSSFDGGTVRALGGNDQSGLSNAGDVFNAGGGAGFSSSVNSNVDGAGGGGGGGYAGGGGRGGGNSTGAAQAGTGGGGGGGASASAGARGGKGGGTGLKGQGSSGAAGSGSGDDGKPGSDGVGQLYGGGGSGGQSSRRSGESGAVRIIWGPGRSFPSTGTADV